MSGNISTVTSRDNMLGFRTKIRKISTNVLESLIFDNFSIDALIASSLHTLRTSRILFNLSVKIDCIVVFLCKISSKIESAEINV